MGICTDWVYDAESFAAWGTWAAVLAALGIALASKGPSVSRRSPGLRGRDALRSRDDSGLRHPHRTHLHLSLHGCFRRVI